MAKFNYGKSRNTATKLIDKFGQSAVLTRIEQGDPSDWESSGGSKSEYAVTVAMLPASNGKIEGFDLKFDTSFIVQYVRFGLMAYDMKKISGDGPDHIFPIPTDIIVVDNVSLSLLGSRELNPAGTSVCYSFAGKV